MVKCQALKALGILPLELNKDMSSDGLKELIGLYKLVFTLVITAISALISYVGLNAKVFFTLEIENNEINVLVASMAILVFSLSAMKIYLKIVKLIKELGDR